MFIFFFVPEVEAACEAYIYFYPVVVFMTKLFQESVWPHTPGYLSINTFNHQTEVLDWTQSDVSGPSVDHLYSRAWLDLERKPLVLNIPDIPEQVLIHSCTCTGFYPVGEGKPPPPPHTHTDFNGRLQSLDWTGGLDWWTGLLD